MSDKKSFSKWYDKNKDEHNAKRREAYRKNKALRDKAKERAREQRKSGHVAQPRTYTRKLGTVFVTCHSITAAATAIDRTAQLIRTWEAKGLIPASVFEGSQRLYTQNQIGLLKRLAEFFDEHRNNRQYIEEHLDTLVQEIYLQWTKIQ